MKTILILTDFSGNAAHAAKAAIMLGSKLRTDIRLFNTFIHAVVIPNYAGGPVSAGEIIEMEDESRSNLNKLSEDLNHSIAQLPTDSYRPFVTYQLGEGSLSNNIRELTAAQDVEMVVMGAPLDSTFDHLLMGSDTYAVAQKTNCPLLVVPADSDLQVLKKLVFATGFDTADLEAIKYLVSFCKFFTCQLEIIHVSVFHEDKNISHKKETLFRNELNKIKDTHIIYRSLKGKNAVERINRHCTETAADMLAMTHHRYSFFAGLLKRSTIKKALMKLDIPLLILPIKAN